MRATGAATVLHVKSLGESLKFYTDVLGFDEEFRYGDYAGVRSGEALIHLSAHSTNTKPAGSGHVYIFCDDVDSYYAEITAKGAQAKSEPRDYPYGMRDFEVVDVDGNFLAFGSESS